MLYWLKSLFGNPAALFKALGVESGDTILEVGCAIGYHTLPLARLAAPGKVYAVDVWAEGLAYLQDRAAALRNVETICGDAAIIELPVSSVDKVVWFDTLHDIPNSPQAVDRWAGLLKPGGVMLHRDPEILPEKVATYSGGRLELTKSVSGIHVLVRR